MKYNNKKVVINGMKFDSRREASRYIELKLLMQAGIITDLQTQVKFELIPSQKKDKKTIERPITYIADFVYKENGEVVVEDTKGFCTKDYIIKRKLMLFMKQIQVKEI